VLLGCGKKATELTSPFYTYTMMLLRVRPRFGGNVKPRLRTAHSDLEHARGSSTRCTNDNCRPNVTQAP